LFQKFTGTTWIVMHGPKSILESAKVFNTILIPFTVHGAENIATMYMQPRTVFINVLNPGATWAYWNLSRILGLHHVTTMLPKMEHLRVTPPETMLVNLSIAERMLRTALALLKG
jgi:hypothetical protein